MLYSIKTINSVVEGVLKDDSDAEIQSIITDSRKISNPKNALFFAIVGKKRDGHDFIKEAYEKGVRNFVVSQNVLETYTETNFITVNNTLEALQKLASYHRSSLNFPVIGITGSNGKTVIKEWLYLLLKDDYNIIRSPKSYNSQLGVPLSILLSNENHNLGIFEAGISLPNEMQNLEKIIQPDIVVFTNLGTAHQQNFDSFEHKAIEKSQLAKNTRFIIYRKDYKELDQIFATYPTNKRKCWSDKKNAQIQISQIKKEAKHTHIQAIYNNDFINIDIPFIDDASIENAIHCWIVMLHLGFEQATIAEKMLKLLPIAMRLEVKEGINDCVIINDSYNSDITSLEIALDFLNRQQKNSRNTLILSDIQQTGIEEKELYQKVAGLIEQKNIYQFIGVGPIISKFRELFSENSKFYNDTETLISDLINIRLKQENILLKGSRVFCFEKISKVLQKKIHKTVMEVNLNALENNLNYFKGLLQPETKVMVMVKALAYGSGAYEIANLLQFHKVDYLGVAYVDEGVELREAGIELPIMVMNPDPNGYVKMIEYDLEPEIFNWKSLNEFINAVHQTEIKQPIPIHLKIDTGMRRLGFEVSEVAKLGDFLKQHQNSIVIKSAFSHLATSDDKQHREFTLKQINAFKKATDHLSQLLSYKFIKHILNSAGIIAYSEHQMDMVRLGIGLYGSSPYPEIQNELEVVSELKTNISQIKSIQKGESVGYGRMEIANSDMKIATVPIGYADGLSRLLGNRNSYMLIHNKKAPIIGNVCMDMTMLDITDIECIEGDEVEVFGKNIPIQQIAKLCNTISYEIFTSISPRVKRVYFQE